MTAEQSTKWAGVAGEPYDACYHRACDSYPDNIDEHALGHATNATAHALWTLAVLP